jgi:hypothetical protein
MSTSLAPIIVFVFNRLPHTRQTIEALQQNEGAGRSHLFVYSDGPRSADDTATVRSVRDYIREIRGFREVSVIEREANLGLSRSVISGVTEIVSRYGRAIVLEDDMVTSPYFLKFMNDALDLYQDDEKVISVHGYTFPVKKALPMTFFLRGADCWGWGTWKRGWDLFEPEGALLFAELRQRKLERSFDHDGSYPYTKMLEDQIAGNNDSWAIRWHASAFLKDKLTLYPGKSLVYNTGLDASGTHCTASHVYDTSVSQKPVRIIRIKIEEDPEARKIVREYFLSSRLTLVQRTIARIGGVLMNRRTSMLNVSM